MTWTARRGLWLVLVVGAGVRLAVAASVGPGNDEAYYWQYTVHPSWGYFDHPPMLAWVMRPGLAGIGHSALGLRLGFVAMGTVSAWLLARLTVRVYGETAGTLAAVGWSATGAFGLAYGTFALPDGPLVMFWLLAIERFAAAIAAPGRVGPWIGVGLAWGGALLSKYQGVFLLIGAWVFLAIEPTTRPALRRIGPFLAAGIALLMFAPVIAWNATNGWVSFAFQAGRASVEAGAGFRPDALLTALAGQAVYLFPWMALSLVKSVRRRLGDGPLQPVERFWLIQAIGPLALTGVSCWRPILPHWPLVGWVSLFPFLGRSWMILAATDSARTVRRLAVVVVLPIAIAAVGVGHVRWGWLADRSGRTLGLVAAEADPSLDLIGWDAIVRELESRRLLDPEEFLFTGHWPQSGQLAFALGGRVPVYCYSKDPRGFGLWFDPSAGVGRNGLLVAVDNRSTEPQCFDRWFARIEPLGGFAIGRAGRPVRPVRLFRCIGQTRPFPNATRAEESVAPGTLRR